jgi:hypothetical protein
MRIFLTTILIASTWTVLAQQNPKARHYPNGNGIPTTGEVKAKLKKAEDRTSQGNPQFKAGGGNTNNLFTTGPEQDCDGAIAVCQQTYTEPNSYTGYGNVQEVYNTCLSNGEQYSVWYVFTVQNSGDFSFTIQTQNDYDFALYDITTIGCAGVPNASPVRCNFSATYGNTGLSLPPSPTIPLSYGAGGAPMMPGLDVTAGSTYVLIIDNWTQDNNGYTITFGGTASIFDATPPGFLAAAQNCTTFDQINVAFDEPIQCNSIQSNGADFTLTGPSGAVTIIAAAGVSCSGVLTSDAIITIDNSTQIPSGTYTLTHIGGLLDKCGNAMNNGETISFDYLAPITISASATQVCQGDSATLTAIGGPSSGATYSWSPGGSTDSSLVVTPTASTSYSVTVSYGSCIGSATQVVSIGGIPVVSVTPINLALCSGTTPITATAMINGNACTDCNFYWTGSATQTDMNTSFSTIANADTGFYAVSVTSAIGCLGNQTTSVISDPDVSPLPTCNVIYVSTGGTGDGLTRSTPTVLDTALIMAQCNNVVIKMESGTYNISNPITNASSNVTIEGGYDVGFLAKSSIAGRTVILRDAMNPQGPATAQRLVAVEVTSASNFRFQDLTIQTVNATATGQEGMSTYALYLTSCSNYEIIRCQLIAGDGSAGDGDDNPATYNATWDGEDGSSGSSGGVGAKGNSTCTAFCAICLADNGGNAGSGGSGGAGGANAASIGGNALSGTNGGDGGDGSDDEQAGTCTDGAVGSAGIGASGGTAGIAGLEDSDNGDTPYGGDGGDGGSGASGMNGSTVASNYSLGYYIPSYGTDGTAGINGFGGGGGGGAGCDNGGWCRGSGGGGSGGSGGSGGGGAGRGAYGGGGSFSIFVWSGGTGGLIEDCDLQNNAGAAGIGGNGGTGGTGTPFTDRASGSACANGDGDCNRGGTGGAGGSAGDGGSGGSGTAGDSFGIYLDGSSPTLIQDGSIITVNPGGNSPTIFDLAAQPEIIVSNIACTNTAMEYTSTGATTWDFGANAAPPIGTGTSDTVQYSVIGRKTIQMDAETYTGFTNILVDDSIAGTILKSASSICPDTASFSYSGAGTLGLSYSWSVSPTTDSILSADSSFTQIDFSSTTTTTTYVVTLDISSECCGQLPSFTDSITVIPPEDPMVMNDTICEGGTATLYATNGPGFTYNWYDQASGGTLLATDSGYTVTGATSTTTFYVETVNALGCVGNRIAVTLVVAPLTAPTAPNVVACDTGLVYVIVDPVSGATAYNWYDQASGGTLLQSNNGFSYGVYISTTGTSVDVYVSYTIPGCGESPRTMVTASVDNNIIATNPTFDTVCAGASVTLNAGASGGTGSFTYLWSPINTSDSIVANPTVSPTTSTSYNVVITSGPCEVTVSIPVIVSGQITTSFAISNLACNGDANGSITVSALGGTPPLTYQWDAQAGGGMDSSVTGLSGGTYLVTITDASGCGQIDSATITEPSALSILVSATDANCGNTDGDATVTATGGTLPYVYVWDDIAAQTTTTATGLGGGSYSVLVADSMGCQDSASVTVADIPLVVTVSGDSSLCLGETTQLTAGGGTTFSWLTGETTATITISPAVTTNYTVVVSTPTCPADTAMVTVIVNQLPVIQVTPESITIAEGTSTQLNASGASTYTWTPTEGLSCSNCSNPEASPATTTTYWVTGTDAQGCSDSTSVTVTVSDIDNIVYLPNTFSPLDDNGDNLTLQVFGSNIVEINLVIFDRWGEKVYESTDATEAIRSDGKCCAYGKGWDGTWKNGGTKVNVASFAYLLRGKFRDGEEFEKHGNITLIKQ